MRLTAPTSLGGRNIPARSRPNVLGNTHPSGRTGRCIMEREDTINSELLALEKKYWNAIKEKDPSTAVSLSGDPCVVVGAQGVGEIGKTALASMMEGAGYDLKEFSFDDVHVRKVTDDVAVVAYKVKEDLIVEGKSLTLEAFDSSI